MVNKKDFLYYLRREATLKLEGILQCTKIRKKPIQNREKQNN